SCVLRDDAAVLGNLFTGNCPDTFALVHERPDEAECERIIDSAGQRLVSGYWGQYVAVLRSRDGNACHVLRDPSGALPCYLTSHLGLHIVFSHVHDLANLKLVPLTINPNALHAI